MFGGTMNTTFNKPGTQTGFGTTGLFGSTTPAASNSLFGGGQTATATTQQSTGLFGASSTGFGQTPAQNTFGGFGQTAPQQPNTGSMFGNTGQQSTGLFATPTPAASTFGAKTPAAGGMFGAATPAVGGSLFGGGASSTVAPATATAGMFGGGTTQGFGGAASQSGTTVKFNPPSGQDTMLKSGVTTNISTRHQCITAMKEYETKSLEELRTEDYTANRKGPQPGSTGLFNQTQTTQPQSTGFGGFGQQQSKPTGFTFGQSNTGTSTTAGSLFSQPQQTQAGGLFGATTTKPLFGGTTTTTTSTAGFGGFGNTGNTLFGGQNKSLFGQTASTQGSTLFGNTQTASTAASTGFGFGVNTQAQAGGGLFGNKTTGFGQTATSTGLTFGQPSAGTGMFGNKPAGQSTTGFSFGQANTGGFGTNTSGGLFGNKPTGFGTTTNTLGGMSGFGNSLGTGTATAAGMFNATQNKPAVGFGTGFGTSTGFGGLGNTGLAQNAAANNPLAQPGTGQDNQAQTQQQLLTLANAPYGDSPLFRNLNEDVARREELLKPTNPVAQKAALAAGSQYKVSPRPTAKIKPKPLHSLVSGKSQLFDGLEDEESSFGNDTFVPRRSIKKLVIKNNDSMSNASFSKQSSHADDLDTSQAPSPEPVSNGKEDRVRFTDSVLSRDEAPRDVTRNSLAKDHVERNIATGLFTNVNESFLNDTISDFNPKSRLEVTRGGSAVGDDESPSAEPDNPPPPHPAGIVLHRHGYYTLPSLDELRDKVDRNGDCCVDDFVVGREGYGNVMFPGPTNIANMNFDEIVFFRRKEVTIYPEDDKKPPVGSELNKKAQVTLDCVWPADKSTRNYIKSPERLQGMQYQEKLERATAKIGATFIDYRPETGSWVFEVNHFSKYGLLDDSDDEDEASMDPKKLLLLKQQQQQQLAVQKQKIEQLPGQKPPVQVPEVSKGQDLGMQWQEGHGRVIQEPVPMELPQSRPLFSDDEDLDDLMDEVEPKEMGEIDDMDVHDVAPSSHRLANRLGVLAQELQLRKASFFGDEEEEIVPKWKVGHSYPTKNLLQPSLGPDPEVVSQATELPWSPARSLLATSFSKPPPRQASPLKRVHPLATGVLSKAPTTSGRASEHILLPTSTAHQPKTRAVVGSRMKRKIPLLEDSLFSNKHHVIMDAGLVRSQAFRVGWGPELKLVHAGKPLEHKEDVKKVDTQKFVLLQHKGSAERSRLGTDAQQLTLEQMYVSPSEQTADQHRLLSEVIEEHLSIQLEHTALSVEQGCPQAVPRPGNNMLQQLVDCASSAQQSLAGVADCELYKQARLVWELCVALWGELKNLPLDDVRPDSYAYHLARQEAFSEWLSRAVVDHVDQDLQTIKVDSEGEAAMIFHHLSGRQLQAACELAQQTGDHRLALLAAQASGSDNCRAMVNKQLAMWEQSKMDHFLDDDRLRIYALLSGNMVWTTSNGSRVDVCQDLDWKRALAVHLWYHCSPTATIHDALAAYNRAHQPGSVASYAVSPLPQYFEQVSVDPDDPPNKQDVCYHLVRLYCDRSHPLHSLLCPTSVTPNYLDFRLSWQLGQVLQSLEYTHLSEYHAAMLCASYAAQLENLGLWHWAVFVLLHITDSRHREHSVKELLQRHIRLRSDEEAQGREDFLQMALKVPSAWIHQAKAVHAGHLDLREEEAWHWLRAGQSNRSHQLILTHLASSAIVNDNFEDLKSLLGELGSPEVCRNIEDWDKGGQVYLDYITMIETLEQLQQSEPSAYELEKLQTEVSVLSKRITALECHTATDRLCKSEMAKRAANLMRTLLVMRDDEDINELLVTETSDLPLPEDYALQELHQLTRSYMMAVAMS